MQFYLNGFRRNDRPFGESADRGEARNASDRIPDQVDVLIVGCGPTGLALAAQLAAFPAIKTRIVDQKPGPLQIGQADGIACRTMEMFEAFGFCHQVIREAYWVNETCFWTPEKTRPQHIVRSRVIQDVEDGLSEFPHVILNQARVHDFFLEVMRRAPARLEPDYSRRFVDLQVRESQQARAGYLRPPRHRSERRRSRRREAGSIRRAGPSARCSPGVGRLPSALHA